jgi:hypothetical protein
MRPGRRDDQHRDPVVADADPIAAYLSQLHAGLKIAPAEVELIMTEAEDHLRETTAAGITVGMTEREAQEAAISSFGPARAVIQAHQARVNRAALRSGETAIAACKLSALLALSGGVTGLATTASLLAADRAGITVYVFMVRGPSGPLGMVRPRPWSVFGPAPRNLSIMGTIVTSPSVLTWLSCALAVVFGLASLGVYRRVRWRVTVRREPLAGVFPVVAAGFCGALGTAAIGLCQVGTWAAIIPGMIAAAVVLAAGCAVRIARTLNREGAVRSAPGWSA